MRTNSPWGRYPFGFLQKRWSRIFFLGFVALIAVMSVIDSWLADFRYIRLIDTLLVGGYGVIWALVYWFRPELFHGGITMVSPERELLRAMEEFADRRRVSVAAVITLAVLVFGLGDLRNGWSALLPPLIGPTITTAIFLCRAQWFFPPALLFGARPDEHPQANEMLRRLHEGIRSSRAKRTLLSGALWTVVIVVVIVGLVLVVRGDALLWDVKLEAIVPLTVLFALWSMLVNFHILVRWVLSSGILEGRDSR